MGAFMLHTSSAASDTEEQMLTETQVFAVVVGCLSSVTTLVYAVPFMFHAMGFIAPIWNLVLFILNITLFGVFAKVRFHCPPSLSFPWEEPR